MLKWLKKRCIMALSIIISLLVLVIAGTVMSEVSHGQDRERVSLLSDAVRKAAVQCYAIEGYYPTDIEYLEKNYALIVDRNRFFIYYEAFASNIMPRIDVYSIDADGRVSDVPY